jgi:hypothetical protein
MDKMSGILVKLLLEVTNIFQSRAAELEDLRAQTDHTQ